MSFIRHLRTLLPLILGLGLGALGATLLKDSLPGAEGSPEARASKLEVDLKKAQNQILALESSGPPKPVRHEKTLQHELRKIADDIRAGRPVSPEDIFRVTQPLLRDLAPLFDRMRTKQQQQMIDSKTGEIVRKYGLDAAQQTVLRQWFEQKAATEAQKWNDLIARDGTRLEDIMKASRDVRPDEGLDAVMGTVLTGDKLAAFKSDRLAQKAERVQSEADGYVQRLDGIVPLDETQRDQVFGIVARNSRDYDPAMRLEGTGGGIAAAPAGSRQQAVLSVLRPDQRSAYDKEMQRRRSRAEQEARAIGLTAPPDFDAFDDNF